MVKFLKRWNGNFFSRRLALLLIVVLYFLGQALIVFDGHMDGRNHLVWLDGFPIFLGQVTIRFDACKWLSNVHHRSNNNISSLQSTESFHRFLFPFCSAVFLEDGGNYVFWGNWYELTVLKGAPTHPLTILMNLLCQPPTTWSLFFFFISSLLLHFFPPQFSP